MTSEERYWWRIVLELKLRKSNGDAFQEFFSALMAKLHGEDFVRVRPFGSLGDKGCDGYLQSCGQVFQCYGALNGDSARVQYLIAKMGTDYNSAAEKLAMLMKEWHMVHNLVEGLPIQAIEKLEELRKADTGRKFGFIGIEGFEKRIFSLAPEHIQDLLGMAASTADALNMQVAELRALVAAVSSEADYSPGDIPIKPVPCDKLEFNKLPNHWRHLISGGWQNAHIVARYLDDHPDPLTGERIAQVFRVRYEYLKAQGLASGAVMSGLYEMVTGIGIVPPERQVAAQALLAFLFESCDIFEDEPAKVVQ
jgi:hypothetical protein